jgi:hypothetical protein
MNTSLDALSLFELELLRTLIGCPVPAWVLRHFRPESRAALDELIQKGYAEVKGDGSVEASPRAKELMWIRDQTISRFMVGNGIQHQDGRTGTVTMLLGRWFKVRPHDGGWYTNGGGEEEDWYTNNIIGLTEIPQPSRLD